ncbi:hypothetical protein Tco_0668054 [Tanacetum coccineum]
MAQLSRSIRVGERILTKEGKINKERRQERRTSRQADTSHMVRHARERLSQKTWRSQRYAAVQSTAHRDAKIPVDAQAEIVPSTTPPHRLKECNTVTCDVTQTQRQHTTKVTNLKVAIHPDYPEQEVSIGGSLSDTGRAAVCALLQRNLDIFAWEPKHMTGVPRSITEHKLKIRQGYSPVRQKKRGQAPERLRAILEDGTLNTWRQYIHARSLLHDWISNPVYGQKELMVAGGCALDFTDINKACPNKTAIHYRRIDWKWSSPYAEPDGIKPCPEKTKAVIQLPSPRTLKEVQSLNGKLAGLNRFLSKSADKSLPCSNTQEVFEQKGETSVGLQQQNESISRASS